MQISEREFTTQVIQLAQLHGWKVVHFRAAKTGSGWRTAMQGDSGFPDIIAARNGRVVAAELKVGKNQPTDCQREWLAHWGQDAYLWRPADWTQIQHIFGGGR